MTTQDTKRIETVWDEKGNLPTNAIVATADGKYPALDGSLITNIGGGGSVVTLDGTGDSAAISAAISGLTASRTHIETVELIGSGIITEAIVLPSYTRLLINGYIKLADSTNTAMIVTDDQAAKTEQIYIDGNGTLDGNKANQTTEVNVIDLRVQLDFSIRGIRIVNAEQHGIYIFEGAQGLVSDVNVQDSDNSGIHLSRCGGSSAFTITQSQAVEITNVNCSNNDIGVYVEWSHDTYLHDSVGEWNTSAFAYFKGPIQNIIQGNFCERNGKGIVIEADNTDADTTDCYVQISGNEVSRSAYGIQLINSGSHTTHPFVADISGNMVENPDGAPQRGIEVNKVFDLLQVNISNNVISAGTEPLVVEGGFLASDIGRAIYILGEAGSRTPDAATIRNNNIDGMGRGIQLSLVDGVMVAGNSITNTWDDVTAEQYNYVLFDADNTIFTNNRLGATGTYSQNSFISGSANLTSLFNHGESATFDLDLLGSDTATDGYVATADGAGGVVWEAAAGGGDMLAATYDPTTVAGDAFDMDNMVEGTTTKILTDAERTKLAGIEEGATADQTGAEIKTAYEAEANTNAFTDAEKTTLSNQSGTNTGDQDLTAVSVNAQTGTTYTLVLADAGKVVSMSNASANTLTIPLNSSVAFANGTIIVVEMLGAGTTSIAGATGVTVNGVSAGSGDVSGQYSAVSLRKVSTDTWVAVGSIGTVA